MSKHTPGPWTIHRHSSTSVQGSRGFVVANTGGWLTTSLDIESVVKEQEANARLIAAAPELLEALEKLANEASGFLAMADPLTHGFTNMAVLGMRIDTARTALNRAKNDDHSPNAGRTKGE
jgi:hypothetical protein